MTLTEMGLLVAAQTRAATGGTDAAIAFRTLKHELLAGGTVPYASKPASGNRRPMDARIGIDLGVPGPPM